MIKVFCRTNLDLHNEVWPDELPALPNISDYITSRTKHGIFQLQLQVCRITWEYHESTWGDNEPGWYPNIELHMTEFQRGIYPKDNQGRTVAPGSITAFYQWYAPLVGRTVGSFI